MPLSVSSAKGKVEINMRIDVTLESVSHNEVTSICTERFCTITKLQYRMATYSLLFQVVIHVTSLRSINFSVRWFSV